MMMISRISRGSNYQVYQFVGHDGIKLPTGNVIAMYVNNKTAIEAMVALGNAWPDIQKSVELTSMNSPKVVG